MANKVEIQIVGNNVYAINAIDGTKKKLGQLKKAGDDVNDMFGRLKKQIVGAFTVGAVMSFMQSSIQAYREQEIAIRKLDTALGKSSSSLQDYANELQKTTVFADELTVEAMSLIAAFTKDEEQIRKLTQAAADLSAAKGIDLVTAADMLTKSVFTETNALKRQGVEINGVAGSYQRLESAVNRINELYGGQAVAQGKTLSGQMDILNNKLNEQQETIGSGLLPVWVLLNEAGAGLISIFQDLSGYTFFTQLMEQEKEALEKAKKFAGERYDIISKTFTLIQNTAGPMVFLTEEQKKAFELAKKQREEEEKKLAAIIKQNEEYQHQLNKAVYGKDKIQPRGIEDFGVGVPLEMVTTYYNTRAQLSLEFTTQEIANWLLMQDVSVDIFGNMAGAAMNFYDASGNAAKGWFGVYKAMAIAQTAIATYQAAVEAYKAMVGIPIVGPGLAVAAAAAATAFGISNIARIAAMQPGGSFGGGGSASVPSIPAGNITNNNQRSNNYVITINTQGGWEGDKDKFARELIYYIDKARGDGG